MKETKILCLHGFGKRRGKQFAAIREAFADRYEILSPDYYELKKEDAKAACWLANVRTILEAHKEEELIVIGFSLGALIAMHFAKEYAFRKLILLSPSFDEKRFLEVKHTNPDPAVPQEYLGVFCDVLQTCLPAVEEIACPVTVLHAKNDELIPYEYTEAYFEKIPVTQKKLYLLEGGSHTILDDPQTKDRVMEILAEELQ